MRLTPPAQCVTPRSPEPEKSTACRGRSTFTQIPQLDQLRLFCLRSCFIAMDPLSIAIGVLSATSTCIKPIKQLNDLRSKYRNASLTLTALCSESALILASLTEIHNQCLDNVSSLGINSYLNSRPDLCDTLDRALTGCVAVYSCLEAEIEEITKTTPNSQGEYSRKAKTKLLWNENSMKEYLSHIRGQQSALSLLIQSFQM
jgi:hypothetical protein